MLVYGHRSFALEPRRFLGGLYARLERTSGAPSHDELTALLVDVGEAEAGVADAVMPEIDAEADELSGWREIAGAIAAANCASWYGDTASVAPALHRARAAAAALLCQPLVPVVRARAAEGFACYSLYPEQYIAAAEQLLAVARPQAVFCVGLRSIGSILAHVVAAALERSGVRAIVRSVRPRGHPFDRHLRLARSLKQTIHSSGCDAVAVVDEGPGLSASSFAAAVEALAVIGIPHDRILIVAAWAGDPLRFKSPRGRRAWETCRVFVGARDPFERHAATRDFSGGQWRHFTFAARAEWPASQPQHERPKLVDLESRSIARFAGLGKFGSRRFDRAAALHAAGFGPQPVRLRNGSLELEWIAGAPVRAVSDALLARAADYLAFIRRTFGVGLPDAVDELHCLIAANTAEAGLAVDLREPLRQLGTDQGERVAVDGRMLPHDWIRTRDGFVKVDALDHHDDDFFPGCRDIAWDIAGACVEWQLDVPAAAYLVARYERSSGDRIAHRLPFYEAAYAAYRLGYARVAGSSVDAADAARFSRLEHRYANRLRRFQRRA